MKIQYARFDKLEKFVNAIQKKLEKQDLDDEFDDEDIFLRWTWKGLGGWRLHKHFLLE